ncbi:MAG: hypothetical protein O3B84_06585, partial [Chloroflexi bacterium]|nr:hypothetical protein [Chloroflexota bacterium]
MPWTTTGSLADSLPTVVDAARLVREFEGVMVRLVDRKDKAKNHGTTWNEVDIAAISAASVTELTINENFQQITDTIRSIEPTLVQVVVMMTDRMKRRVDSKVAASLGQLSQNAMQRKKDIDLLAQGQAATTDLGSAGNPMAAGQISAAVSRICGNASEPAVSAVSTVLHNFGIADIQNELKGGVGTYPI